MPPKTAKRTFRRKRQYPLRKKRYTKRSTVNRIYVPRNPVSKSAIVHLKYVQDKKIDLVDSTPANTPVYFWMVANGMYDPDYSLGGHQPMGFDQWMSFYDHYTVLGSKITVTIQSQSNISSSVLNNVFGGIYVDDDATAHNNINQLMEQGGSLYKPIVPYQAGITRMTKTFSAKKFFAKRNVNDDPSLKGDASGNPSEEAFYACWFGSPQSLVNQTLYINIVMQFTALLSEPKTLAQS